MFKEKKFLQKFIIENNFANTRLNALDVLIQCIHDIAKKTKTKQKNIDIKLDIICKGQNLLIMKNYKYS